MFVVRNTIRKTLHTNTTGTADNTSILMTIGNTEQILEVLVDIAADPKLADFDLRLLLAEQIILSCEGEGHGPSVVAFNLGHMTAHYARVDGRVQTIQ